jgi:hypothetical protein
VGVGVAFAAAWRGRYLLFSCAFYTTGKPKIQKITIAQKKTTQKLTFVFPSFIANLFYH